MSVSLPNIRVGLGWSVTIHNEPILKLQYNAAQAKVFIKGVVTKAYCLTAT
jgi:hypothetical protein